jgi:hypothetical protein
LVVLLVIGALATVGTTARGQAPKPMSATSTASSAAPVTSPGAAPTLPTTETLAPSSYVSRFNANAFQMLTQVSRIQSQTGQVALSPDELELFQEASTGRATHWTMADAAMLISGVTDRSERQRYVGQINQIIEQAKTATADAQTTKDKASALAKFLLKGPMHAGYVEGKFDMRTLLDTGHFNCVSSAALYIITAHAIGLPVGAVLQTKHIFVRVPDFDVEPTSGQVYPAEIRKQRILEGLERSKSDVADTFSMDRLYHETGDFGVLESIYYDEGCDQEKAGKFDAAAVSDLKAACLDPSDPNLGKHLDQNLSRWFKSALQNKQLAQAGQIAYLYRQTSRDQANANSMMNQMFAAQMQAKRP